MRTNRGQLRITANTIRQAFTLVELMVVGAIILLLIALTLFAMSMVTASTKITRTRATVQKIDTAMQPIFQTYEDKFAAITQKIAADYPVPALTEEEQQKIAAHFIRDTMRMEMPSSWAEVYDSAANPRAPLRPIPMTLGGTTYTAIESPLLNYYWQEYDRVHQTGKEPNRAALLFLIVQNLNPEALEAFHASEIADTDGDGLLEFVDAWGKPIQFLRWAPAFSDSDLQQDVLKMAGDFPKTASQSGKENWWGARGQRLLAAMQQARINHPDPMDERVDMEVIGWFLYPLIYSAGPDGKYGLSVETIDNNGNPQSPKVGQQEGILDPFMEPYGMPYGSDHFDNIHNHRWYRSY